MVFDITLEGSARKLITIRSGLTIINNLPELIEIKLESRLPHDSVTLWVSFDGNWIMKTIKVTSSGSK